MSASSRAVIIAHLSTAGPFRLLLQWGHHQWLARTVPVQMITAAGW